MPNKKQTYQKNYTYRGNQNCRATINKQNSPQNMRRNFTLSQMGHSCSSQKSSSRIQEDREQAFRCLRFLRVNHFMQSWCGHEVQAPNYTHIQEKEQKEDGPACGLMDGAYQLLGLKLSKPEHLMIRVSLGFLLLAI